MFTCVDRDYIKVFIYKFNIIKINDQKELLFSKKEYHIQEN